MGKVWIDPAKAGPEGRHGFATAECLVARRSLSRYCRDSPERDEPNTCEGVQKAPGKAA